MPSANTRHRGLSNHKTDDWTRTPKKGTDHALALSERGGGPSKEEDWTRTPKKEIDHALGLSDRGGG